MTDIAERLRVKAGMLVMGEKIAFGSDAAIMDEAAAEIERLRTEIEVLRSYGNKDCTAMADAALEEKRRTGKFPFED